MGSREPSQKIREPGHHSASHLRIDPLRVSTFLGFSISHGNAEVAEVV
jgi:hypothetical protein